MFELNAKQEMALSIVWMRQDKLPRDLTDLEITRHLLALRDSRMISMQTDMSNSMAYVEALCPSVLLDANTIVGRAKPEGSLSV